MNYLAEYDEDALTRWLEEYVRNRAPEGSMRVGPNTDAVVWKICDTNQTVEL